MANEDKAPYTMYEPHNFPKVPNHILRRNKSMTRNRVIGSRLRTLGRGIFGAAMGAAGEDPRDILNYRRNAREEEEFRNRNKQWEPDRYKKGKTKKKKGAKRPDPYEYTAPNEKETNANSPARRIARDNAISSARIETSLARIHTSLTSIHRRLDTMGKGSAAPAGSGGGLLDTAINAAGLGMLALKTKAALLGITKVVGAFATSPVGLAILGTAAVGAGASIASRKIVEENKKLGLSNSDKTITEDEKKEWLALPKEEKEKYRNNPSEWKKATRPSAPDDSTGKVGPVGPFRLNRQKGRGLSPMSDKDITTLAGKLKSPSKAESAAAKVGAGITQPIKIPTPVERELSPTDRAIMDAGKRSIWGGLGGGAVPSGGAPGTYTNPDDSSTQQRIAGEVRGRMAGRGGGTPSSSGDTSGTPPGAPTPSTYSQAPGTFNAPSWAGGFGSLQGTGTGGTSSPGGQHRPVYKLGDADLSDAVIRTIAGEAKLNNPEGIDAVINTMMNRVGSKGYGASSNLHEVAAAKGQFAGYNKGKVTPAQAEMIRERIKAIASGSVPDNTNGANEFRTTGYQGPWSRNNPNAVDIGGNSFAHNPKGAGPNLPYSRTGQIPPTNTNNSPQQQASQVPGINVVPGMEGAYSKNSATQQAAQYKGAIFHVTGKQSVQEQAEFQRKTGFGYKYVIDKDGKLHQMAGDADRPNHIRGGDSPDRTARLDLNNKNALGIGFITGGGQPTPAQLAAAREALPGLYKKHNIPLTNEDGTPNYPMGHGEVQGGDASRNTLGPGRTPEGQAMAAPFRNEAYWKKMAEGGVPQQQTQATPGTSLGQSRNPLLQTQPQQPQATSGAAAQLGRILASNGQTAGERNIAGLNPDTQQRMLALGLLYKDKTGQPLPINSAHRSFEDQSRLYNNPNKKYPVAQPGTSNHEGQYGHGRAFDINRTIADALDADGTLARLGLHRPVRGDPVHIEPIPGATPLDANLQKRIAELQQQSGGSLQQNNSPITLDQAQKLANPNLMPERNLQQRSMMAYGALAPNPTKILDTPPQTIPTKISGSMLGARAAAKAERPATEGMPDIGALTKKTEKDKPLPELAVNDHPNSATGGDAIPTKPTQKQPQPQPPKFTTKTIPASVRTVPNPERTSAVGNAKRLWEIYNKSGNPADFVRADRAQQAIGSIPATITQNVPAKTIKVPVKNSAASSPKPDSPASPGGKEGTTPALWNETNKPELHAPVPESLAKDTFTGRPILGSQLTKVTSDGKPIWNPMSPNMLGPEAKSLAKDTFTGQPILGSALTQRQAPTPTLADTSNPNSVSGGDGLAGENAAVLAQTRSRLSRLQVDTGIAPPTPSGGDATNPIFARLEGKMDALMKEQQKPAQNPAGSQERSPYGTLGNNTQVDKPPKPAPVYNAEKINRGFMYNGGDSASSFGEGSVGGFAI